MAQNGIYNSEEWKAWAKAKTDELVDVYTSTYGETVDNIQHEIIHAGIRSRIDNKYSTAQKKAAVLDNPPELTLKDIMPSKESSSSLAPLRAKLMEHGYSEKEAGDMKGPAVRKTLEILEKLS